MSTTLSRTVVNPRWRSNSDTLISEDDDFDIIIIEDFSEYYSKPQDDARSFIWNKPQTSNNRMVDPLYHSLPTLEIEEDPWERWR